MKWVDVALAALLRRTWRSALALMAMAGTGLAPATAGAEPSITSVYFAPGSASVNGYAQASTVVQYEVRHCGAGTIYLVAGIKPNAMTLDSRYWYKGKLRDIPPHMLVVQAEKMWLRGKAHYGANIAGFGGLVPTADKASCWFDGIGLPAAPKGVKGDDFARTFGIFFDPSTTVLRNVPFEKYQDQLDEAERKAEEERKEMERKQKAEQERQAAATRKQEEERRAAEQKKPAEAQQAKVPAQGGGSGGSAAAAAGGDLWGDGAAGAACGDPQYVKSGNRYFRKDCKGRLEEVNVDDYYRHQTAQAQQQKVEAQRQREQAAATALQQMREQQRLQAERTAQLTAEVDKRMGGLSNAFAAGSRMEESRSNIRDLTSLQRNYDSLDELDADFRNRMNQLGSEFDNVRQAQRERIAAGVDAVYGNENRAYGELTGMVAQLAADRSIEKEEAAARAEMARQRERMQADIIARRKAAQLALRQELLATFADAPVPLSSQKVSADTIYFFSYAYTPGAVAQDSPALTVTNVFPVGRRSDGSWPFKRNLNEELRPLLNGDIAWAGFYTSATDADQQWRQFLDYARKGGFVVKEVQYKGRAPSPNQSGNAGQFWGGQDSGTSRSNDAFWGQPAEADRGNSNTSTAGSANPGFW